MSGISEFFKKLGAPLSNTRWSWGAVCESDGAVFLRVWQDRKVVENGVMFMRLTNNRKYLPLDGSNPGFNERVEHIAMIREGRKCYLIMCRAKDPALSPRKIASFEKHDVFIGGGLREIDGDTYIRVLGRLPIVDLLVARESDTG